MSSLSSPTSLTECRDGLAAALTAVGEQSFFGYVTQVAAPEFAAAAATVPQWMTAAVAFAGGTERGRLHVALPAALAGDLLSAFLGLAEPGATPELADMVGEFANMLCGYWLSESRPATSFALHRPAVSSPGPGGLPWAGAVAPLCVLLNDQPIAVWLEVPGPEATR